MLGLKFRKVKPGAWFTAKINGNRAVGRIHQQLCKAGDYTGEEGLDTYLCQDLVQGARCNNSYGYEYSWVLDKDVTNLKIHAKRPKHPKTPKPPEKFPDIGAYKVTIGPGYVMVGCTEVKNETILALAKRLK